MIWCRRWINASSQCLFAICIDGENEKMACIDGGNKNIMDVSKEGFSGVKFDLCLFWIWSVISLESAKICFLFGN